MNDAGPNDKLLHYISVNIGKRFSRYEEKLKHQKETCLKLSEAVAKKNEAILRYKSELTDNRGLMLKYKALISDERKKYQSIISELRAQLARSKDLISDGHVQRTRTVANERKKYQSIISELRAQLVRSKDLISDGHVQRKKSAADIRNLERDVATLAPLVPLSKYQSFESRQRYSYENDIFGDISARKARVVSGAQGEPLLMSTGHESVFTRKFPYPYLSALSISNDTDGMSFEAFRDIYRTLCYEDGMLDTESFGFEFSNSFWIWNPEQQLSLFHNHPFVDDNLRSREHEILLEMIRNGHIDTLHGFGGWKKQEKLTRDKIEFAIDYLCSQNAMPKIYTNHGGSGDKHGGGGYHMAHNIGGKWGYYQEGDLKDSQSYCLDLLLENGVEYFWTDVCYELEKFGDDTYYSDVNNLLSDFENYSIDRFIKRRVSAKVKDKKRIFSNREEEFEQILNVFNKPIFTENANDGRKIKLFKRFRGVFPPNVGNLSLQLSEKNLSHLVDTNSVAVVYQHFGVWQAIGQKGKHESEKNTTPPVFDDNAMWSLRNLKKKYDDQKIFVTSVYRLLNFIWVRDNLVFTISDCDFDVVVEIIGVRDENQVVKSVPLNDLQGLAFVIKDGNRNLVIRHDARDITSRFSCVNSHGDKTYYFPWQKRKPLVDLLENG